MTATDRPGGATGADDGGIAATIREARLCQLLPAPDGDAVATAALLAAGSDAADTPYHVSAVRTREELRSRLSSADPGAETVVIGPEAPEVTALSGAPASKRAFGIASRLGASPDPALALAGVVAAERDPADATPELLEAADAEPVAGVAIPTGDTADGLAHTTLVHADFSGDRERTADELADLGPDPDPRRVASLLALASAGADGASSRSAEAVERAIRPYRIEGPFPTVGGYADILSGLARRSPGLALALAMTGEGREAALAAWRERAVRTHGAVRSTETARYDGLVVARVDAPVVPTARLIRDFRSPEPAALAVGEREAALAATGDGAGRTVEAAAEAAGGSGLGREHRGYARFDPGKTDAFVDAVRGAL
jgi:hypothetical protein